MKKNNITDKGNYCIIIKMNKESNIKIGAKGIINFKKGYYVYVGSALNSLSKRILRHISKNKKKHWHVDYLLLNKNTEIMEVIYTYCSKKIECTIANEILKDSINNIELFGCSDCKCISHLYYFDSYEDAVKSSMNAYEKNGFESLKWE